MAVTLTLTAVLVTLVSTETVQTFKTISYQKMIKEFF
jgi:hypothetical protein